MTGTTWMESYTGRQIQLPLEPSAVCLEDIAQSLSMQCRYNGHVKRFYSVAEHSVLLSDWILDRTENPDLAFEALMHDASEAYLTDVPRPLKHHLPSYGPLEDQVAKVLAESFGLMYPWADIIMEADTRILHDERAALMDDSGRDWNLAHVRPLGVKIRAWTPVNAHYEFTDRLRRFGWEY